MAKESGPHKQGQRDAFFDYVQLNFGLMEGAAREKILAWAKQHPEFKDDLVRLDNFLRGGTNFLQEDVVLYDFCGFLGKRPRDHALDGERDGVGDFLATFAKKRRKEAAAFGHYEGTYEILRLGAHEIRYGKPKAAEQPGSVEQSYELVIKWLGRSGPHARFIYRDKENPDKPQENKVWWKGRVIATTDALYFVGVTTNNADAAMLILWDHPETSGLLIGLQLAKLAPDTKEKDQRKYTIARRIAAIHRRHGVDADSLRPLAKGWLLESPEGMVVPIDKPQEPSSLCE
jgi:hypothetical protein